MGKEVKRHLGLLDVPYEKYSYLIYHVVYCQVRTCSTKTAWGWFVSSNGSHVTILKRKLQLPRNVVPSNTDGISWILEWVFTGINGPMTGRGKTTRQIRVWVRVCVTVACFSWMSNSPMPSYCTSSFRLLRAEILLGAATLRAFCYLLSRRTTSRQEKLF